jgi:hypothetical protein
MNSNDLNSHTMAAAAPAQAGVVAGTAQAGAVAGPARSGLVSGPYVGTSTSPLATIQIPASPTKYIGRKIALNPRSWSPLDTLLFRLKKTKKYVNSTYLPEESLENVKVIGIINRGGGGVSAL